jgi:hypothetical protein
LREKKNSFCVCARPSPWRGADNFDKEGVEGVEEREGESKTHKATA